MRTQVALGVLLATLTATELAAQPDRRRGDRGRSQSAVELEHFTHHEIRFAAPSMESSWGEASVYVPVGHEKGSDKVYPWVIWLHGMNGNHTRFHNNAAPTLDRLRGAGKIPEMIVVAPSAGRRTCYFNEERSGDCEDLILRDLTDHVLANFPASKAKRQRSIMGISIGGFGAMRLAFKNPDLFAAVVSHSGAVFPADPADLSDRYRQFGLQGLGLAAVLGDPIDPERWSAEVPSAMLASMEPGALKNMRIYFDAGTRDRYGFGELNQGFSELLEKAKVSHTFELHEDGGHSWGSGFPLKGLENSFEFVGEAMTAKTSDAKSGSKSDKD